MPKLNRNLGILILTILWSCQFDPYAHKYTTEKPNEVELVGIYEFEFQTANRSLTEFISPITNKKASPQITINNDGTYSVIDIPVFDFNYPNDFQRLVTTKGKWKISTIGSISNGNGKTEKHYGIILPELPDELKYAGLMNKESPFDIIFGFGDPDQGKVMKFKKK